MTTAEFRDLLATAVPLIATMIVFAILLAKLRHWLEHVIGAYPLLGTEAHSGRPALFPVTAPDDTATESRAYATARDELHWRKTESARSETVPRHIESSARRYTLIRELRTGDLCEVYYAVSGANDYVLKIPRTARGDGLLAKEFETLGQLLEQQGGESYHRYLPQPVETFFDASRRINAFAWRDGFYTSGQILDRHPAGLDGRHLAWMFNRTLEAIGYVHSRGWIHGAVLPPHLMFHAENHGLQLVGWIHAERINRPLKFAPTQFKAWYPPECRRKRPATPSVDIYLAAKSMVYLAGGDPLTETLPQRIPAEIRRFLKGCLLSSPRMRPQNAWELHEEFAELLEGVYGPPQYCRLEMS
jgi:serine/threonine protein kinase